MLPACRFVWAIVLENGQCAKPSGGCGKELSLKGTLKARADADVRGRQPRRLHAGLGGALFISTLISMCKIQD